MRLIRNGTLIRVTSYSLIASLACLLIYSQSKLAKEKIFDNRVSEWNHLRSIPPPRKLLPPPTRESLIKLGKGGWYCNGNSLVLIDVQGNEVERVETGKCGGFGDFEGNLFPRVLTGSEPETIGVVSPDGQNALLYLYRTYPTKGEWGQLLKDVGSGKVQPSGADRGIKAELIMRGSRGSVAWRNKSFVPAMGVWLSPECGRLVFVTSTKHNEPCWDPENGYSEGCAISIVLQDMAKDKSVVIGKYAYLGDENGVNKIRLSPGRRFVIFPAIPILDEGEVRNSISVLVRIDIGKGTFVETPAKDGWDGWKINDEGVAEVLVGGKKWVEIDKAVAGF